MLRVLLVDDEPHARRRLRKLLDPLARQRRVQVVGEAGDGVEALEILGACPVDLLLLDIQMPELDGFDVLERIAPAQRPVVVFATAYDAYALRAFEASAVDYLLKPVSPERLEASVARAERLLRGPQDRAAEDERLSKLLRWLDHRAEPPAPPPPAGSYLRQISVPLRDRLLIVPTTEVVAAEVEEGITWLTTLDERAGTGARTSRHIVSYTLDQLEGHLDPAEFLRVHRSALVRLSHIREMIPWFSGRYKLVLTGGLEVVASRERSRLLKARLMI